MQRRPRRRLHAVDLAADDPPRSLVPCLALTLCGSAVSLPPAPSLPLCAPGRLRFALRCSLACARCASSDCAAPCRSAGTPLLAAEAHTSVHPPPPPTSPPRLRTPRRLRALVRSQVGIPGPASVARACRAANLSLTVTRFAGGVTKRPKHIRACAAGGISGLEISSGRRHNIQGGRAGVVVSYCCVSPYFKPGGSANSSAHTSLQVS